MARTTDINDDNMRHADNSNAHFAKALEGISFPANRQQLVEQAQRNGAEDRILNVLKNMPEGPYNIMPDVFMNTQDAISRVDQGGSNAGASGGRSSSSSKK